MGCPPLASQLLEGTKHTLKPQPIPVFYARSSGWYAVFTVTMFLLQTRAGKGLGTRLVLGGACAELSRLGRLASPEAEAGMMRRVLEALASSSVHTAIEVQSFTRQHRAGKTATSYRQFDLRNTTKY